MALTIEELARVPRWPLEHTLALQGGVRGDTLGAWGHNLVTRFGPDAVARIRERVVPGTAHEDRDRVRAELVAIPPMLSDRDRVPVYAQLVLTEAIVDEFLDGDMLALLPLLVEDTRAGLGRLRLGAMRIAGVGNLIRLGPRTFREVHEKGEHAVDVSGRRAELQFTRNRLFANPTWRVLQVLATRVLFELVGAKGSVLGEDTGDDAFTAIATWT